MPSACGYFDHTAVLAQTRTLDNPTGIVEYQHGKAPAQSGQNFPGVRVAVRQDQRIRLHRNSQALDGVNKLLMQVGIGAQTWRLAGLLAQGNQVGGSYFLQDDSP